MAENRSVAASPKAHLAQRRIEQPSVVSFRNMLELQEVKPKNTLFLGRLSIISLLHVPYFLGRCQGASRNYKGKRIKMQYGVYKQTTYAYTPSHCFKP